MEYKKRIVFSYPAMMLGGSTTSLLSILNRIDYSKFDVDLLLDSHTGPWFDKIPENVNLLPPAYLYTNKRKEIVHRLLSPKYMSAFFISKIISCKDKNPRHGVQYLEMKDVEFYREIKKEYDVAVAFLEGRQCKFVAKHIKAKRKIAWIHIDYGDSQFDPKYDKMSMEKFDKIVLVSEKCKESFDALFPDLKGKTCVIENILSKEHIKKMSEEKCDLKIEEGKINLATTCRISFQSKGLDRAIKAFEMLKMEGLLKDIKWFILGDGPDMEKLKDLINQAQLSEFISLLGMQTNPYKYLKNMTLFFLPSRWEGKPMAVTEAFILGLPVLVTNYTSAHEQVRDAIDGVVVENSTEGIYKGLLYIMRHKKIIEDLRKCVEITDYSNTREMVKIFDLIDHTDN